MVVLPSKNYDCCGGWRRITRSRVGPIKMFAIGVICTFIIGCLISLSPIGIPLDSCQCDQTDSKLISKLKHDQESEQHSSRTLENSFVDSHKLAILVPFRDRFEELLTFAPYMHKFLKQQRINFQIFILNQVDKYRFNRASLINVGFRISRNECDYIAMHDVDLLPLNPQLSYKYPEEGAFHLSSPELHPRYHYPTFVGGILLVKTEDFENVNGMSNQYWGWGLEDDEFYVRLKQAKVTVSRPLNITTGTENSFRHIHDKAHRKRDMVKCYNQWEVTRRRDRKTGLLDVAFKIRNSHEIFIDTASVRVVNIELECDRFKTPWCDCGDVGSSKTNSANSSAKKNLSGKLKNEGKVRVHL